MELHNIDSKTKRELINKATRRIAYKIYANQGDHKFIHAYGKLKAKMMIDHDICITDRMKQKNKVNMFDVLDDEELDLVIKSCRSLCNMYDIGSEELYLN